MKRAVLGLAAALLLLGGGAVAYRLADPPSSALAPRAQADRPPLALLTSLPLVFGERFAIDGGGSPALARLEQRYRVDPIAVADAASLKGKALLLMAHPRAQPAEILVELDQWVRAGGRLVLLADPRLTWESRLPLGDPLRPPPYFADTGLLGQWGIALGEDDRGRGMLRLTDRQCALDEQGLVARCRIGRGQAIVIADADFIMAEGEGAAARFDLLLDELARVEPR